jgi:hypothetical protein
MTGSLCFLASIQLLLPFQFFDDLVQLAEPRVPELVIPLARLARLAVDERY